jgi:hypothetical protein
MLAYQVLRGRSLHRDRTTGSARSIAASADLSLPTRRLGAQLFDAQHAGDAVRPESPFGRVLYSRSIKERLAVVLEVLA